MDETVVGAKREFPFEYERRRPAKARKEDLQSVYEATLDKLKHGALASLGPGFRQGERRNVENLEQSILANRIRETHTGNGEAVESVDIVNRCYLCFSRTTSTTSCFHCTRNCCGTCTRQCDGCEALFCSVCCTADYDERNDRNFCFDCKNGRGKASVVGIPVHCQQEVQLPPPSTRFRQSTLDFHRRGSAQITEEDQSCSMEIV